MSDLIIDDIFVPYGFYCYEPLSVESSKEKGFIMKVKPCGYFHHIEGIEGYCTLLACDVLDEVKECDLNDYVMDEDDFL